MGYRISGRKQWISNGGVADRYTILANAPGGPSWFLVDRGTEGLTYGKPEDKHGIRASNTAAVFLENVEVPVDRLIGTEEGQGMAQAQAVFGYTRLMVAAFGLGAGRDALKRAIRYSQERVQGGGPLSQKQGYTHKLIVPNAVRLEAARAYIEWVAERLDGDEEGLATEGAVAKYLATEAGNKTAEDAIQALGGYGYTREYMVEKIKRDVRITTIYEGTSEIMEWTIARDRWQLHLKSRGQYYQEWATRADGYQAAFGLDDITIAGYQQRAVLVGNCQQGFKTSEHTVGAPVFCHFNGCAYQVARIFLQLAFKTFKQCERVCGGTCKAGDHLVFIHTPHLACVGFHHGIAKCYLAVPAHHHLVAPAD